MDSSIQNLQKIKHIVVMMFENRSFDHMLGFLYKDSNNVSPLGHPFEGLTGNETNPDSSGSPVKVFPIPKDKHPYFWPGTDPGEGYFNTNSQLYGNYKTPAPGTVATNQGFVTDFEYTINWQRAANKKKANSWHIIEGTTGNDIMGMYTPDLLPVLSGLAKGYAVCDHWYCSVPTETLPNRAFLHMATSQGRLNDRDKIYSAKTIFNLLADNNNTWAIYGYQTPALTRQSLQAIPPDHPNGTFGNFTDFKTDAANNNLADYVFLAPQWGPDGNSQHPNYDVAKGEQLLLEIYNILYNSPGWNDTLLIITYDEHGGCYDHVPPPENASQPADCPEIYGFKFNRFGVRVPTVLISPWIEAGTVYRVNKPDTDLNGSQTNVPLPFDHTSVLSTIEKRFGLPNLTARDAAAPHIGGVLTLTTPRTDNPVKGVVAPVSGGLPPAGEAKAAYKNKMSHLQEAGLDMMSRLPEEKGRKKYHHDYWPRIRSSREWEEYIIWHYRYYYE